MMFQALLPLLKGGTLTLTLTGNADDTLTVLVAPKGEGALAQPLVLTATAAELDAEFVNCISKYTGSRKDLQAQMEATDALLKAAQQESAGKAVKALTKQGGNGSTVKPKGAASASGMDDGTAVGFDDDDDDEGSLGDGVPSLAPETPQAAPLACGNIFEMCMPGASQ